MKRRGVVLAWVVLRLPLLGLAAFLFRVQLAEFIEQAFGLGQAVETAVYFASTFSTRMWLFAAGALMLTSIILAAGKLRIAEGIRYVLVLVIAFSGILISFVLLFKAPDSLLRAFVVTLLLAVNILPYEWLAGRAASSGGFRWGVVAGVGVVEAFFPQAYWLWLAGQIQARESIKRWSWMGGVLSAALVWMFILVPFNNPRMLTLGERLHANPAVQKIAEGDTNWIELNAGHGLLYVVGRSTNFLLAYDINDLGAPPLRSEDIGKTQSFAYNPDRQELYAYKAETRELVFLNALTLETLRAIPVPDLSPGDMWVQWHRLTDTIVLSSEADVEIGTPLYLFDRESGDVLATMPLPVIPTAHLVFHPSLPRMYFNSFREPYFAVWDMENYQVANQVQISPRTDRMIFSAADNEVWIASPLDGAVLRYDADTLGYMGSINTSFGDRTLTLDHKRNLLLVGNFINNRLTVIDLTSNKPVARYYLGPWLRTIAIDSEDGVAYVSTVRSLFKVKYAED